MARRSRSSKSRRRGGKLKVAVWFNLILLAALGGWFVMQPPARRGEVSRLVENYFQHNKRIQLTDIAWDIYQLYYSADYVTAPQPGDRTFIYGGAPVATTAEGNVRLLRNAGYLTGYSDEREDPLWSAYYVRDLPELPDPAPRPDQFDPDGRTVARVESSAYSNTGYDRGHLAPNYAIATRYGEAAQRETFLLSNIVPQRHTLNAGVWKDLEMKIATSYPARFGEVWVVAGPVFGERPERLHGNGPEVPAACFMIIVDESDGRVRAEAFLIPQDAPAGADPKNYLTSIDDIERRTGLDFMPELDEAAETKLEAMTASAVW